MFVCDYKERERITLNHKRGSDELKEKKGGPLGVIVLKEIVVASTDVALHRKRLARLPGITNREGNVFSFSDGPSL